jgi:hypothetical protein
LSHAFTAIGSRSYARRVGFCGVKPQRRRYRPAVESDTVRPVRLRISAITASRVHSANGNSIWSGQPLRIDRTTCRSTDASPSLWPPGLGPRFRAANARVPSDSARPVHVATDWRHTPNVRAACASDIPSSTTA